MQPPLPPQGHRSTDWAISQLPAVRSLAGAAEAVRAQLYPACMGGADLATHKLPIVANRPTGRRIARDPTSTWSPRRARRCGGVRVSSPNFGPVATRNATPLSVQDVVPSSSFPLSLHLHTPSLSLSVLPSIQRLRQHGRPFGEMGRNDCEWISGTVAGMSADHAPPRHARLRTTTTAGPATPSFICPSVLNLRRPRRGSSAQVMIATSEKEPLRACHFPSGHSWSTNNVPAWSQ